MNQPQIKLGVLTSSRADYGIYKALLSRLSIDKRFDLHLIVFGTHLLEKFDYTIKEIRQDNFGKILEVPGMPQSDSILEISKGYGEIVKAFAEFWSAYQFDWVLALGDRYEMSAAVQASIPFEVKLAHLHGGETTLGATDNIYRHQISLASNLHFVASEEYKKKVADLTGKEDYIYNVGALSLDGVEKMVLPNWDDVCTKFNIPNVPFVLVTLHPETVGADKNIKFAKIIYESLAELSQQLHIIITMPNADAFGSCFRDTMHNLKLTYPTHFSLIENFGKENYYAAIKSCRFLLGNTSSGIVEAASFHKFVINVGDRQKGRLRNDNIIDIPFNEALITEATKKVIKKGRYQGSNRFFQSGTAARIIQVLANAQL